ncbi:MAG: universal stress protein [Candidatus Sulfotelmatobacter sp.]
MIVQELQTQETLKAAPIFERVLVAVDFSDSSRRALCCALPLLASGKEHISAVHVLKADWRYEVLDSPPELGLEETDAWRRLHSVLDESGPQKNVEATLLQHGPVAQALLSFAARTDTDLIILGTRGLGGFQKLALGSVAEEVLRRAPCPVLTVGPRTCTPERGAAGLRTILFATDFGNGSAKALPLVLKLAVAHGAKLVVLHTTPPIPATSTNVSAYAPGTIAADELREWEGASCKRSLQQLRQWMPQDTGLRQEPEYIVGVNFLPEGILTAAAERKTDLIVMGANQRGSARIAAHMPWTAIHEVLRDAPCPVLSVAG